MTNWYYLLLNLPNYKVKLFFIALAIICTSNSIFSQTTVGPISARAFANVSLSGSSTTWTNTSEADSSDNIYVDIPLDGLSANGAYTDYFQASDFGFAIPIGSTIDGILVEIERGDVNNAKDYIVSIVKGGVIGSEDKSLTPAWSSETYISYGGATDLWSDTWGYTDINATDFGIVFSVKKQGGGANPKPQIDHVRISITYSVALPVELTNFSVEQENNLVEINWTTASEINSDYFSIEKSKNAKDWEAFKRVNSTGNSVEALKYSEIDHNPYSGTSYYRLKMVDLDGSFEYSDLATIVTNHQKTDVRVIVFPNPVSKIHNELNIEYENSDAEFSISILDSFGNIVYKNPNSITGGSTKVNIEKLGLGVYYILLNDGTNVETIMLVRTE